MADEALSTFLVEHYRPGFRESDFLDAARRVGASIARLAAAGHVIEFLHYTLVPDEGSAFCVVAASDQQLVERAYAEAEVGYERLVLAVESPTQAMDGKGARRLTCDE